MAEVGGELVVLDDLRSIAVGAGADGWNATQGTQADPAWSGSGSGSEIAILKAIYGKGGGGAVTEADGANATLGAQANAAWSGSGNGTLIAISKAVYGLLSGQLSIKGAAAAFVAGSFSSGAFADGALTTLGSTTDAPLAAAASTSNSTVNAVLKGLFNLFFNGAARFQTSIWWTELTGASVAAGSTTSATARTSNGTSGAGGSYGYFTAKVYCTQPGQLTVYDTSTANTPVPCGVATVAANTVVTVKVPAFGASFTSQFVANSGNSAAGTLYMSDGFTAA